MKGLLDCGRKFFLPRHYTFTLSRLQKSVEGDLGANTKYFVSMLILNTFQIVKPTEDLEASEYAKSKAIIAVPFADTQAADDGCVLTQLLG